MLNFEVTKFIFVALNLIILYFILKRILFKPVTEFMEKRTLTIKEALDNADEMKKEAASLKQQFDDQLKTAKVEVDKIISDAHAKANKEYDVILASAKKDAEGLVAKAREDMENERAQMIKEIKGQVAGLALIVASKVIEANMDNEKNKALAEKFIDEAGAA